MRKTKSVKSRVVMAAVLSAALCLLSACNGGGDQSALKPENVAEEKQVEESTATAKEETSEDDSDTAEDVAGSNTAVTGENLIPGGDFSESNSHWGLYTESGGSGTISVGNGKLKAKITNPGYKSHSYQVYCDGFELLQGGRYEMSFEAYASEARKIDWRVQINGGDYHAYAGESDMAITTEPQTYTFDFTMAEGSDPAPRLCFNMGDNEKQQGLSEHEVYFDNVCLKLLDSSNATEVDMNTGEVDVNINQLGYRPSDKKVVYVRDCNKDSKFRVIDTKTGKSVYEGQLIVGENKGTSGEKVAMGDFSDVPKGSYYIHTENSGDSFEFSIGDNVYEKPFEGAARMLYLQRCGMDIDKKYSNDFAHEACHTQKATIYGSTTKTDVSGGWHDAGDYGRYSSPAAKAVADILLAYEKNPKAFTDNTQIPESGNGIPDILDEARYELKWLVKMQNGEGGVFHKVTGLNFEGVVMPQEVKDELYVLPASKTATADFAGVMYLASRVYKDIDKDFGDACLKRAKKALNYYEQHIDERNYVNPDDVLTGEYVDGNSSDEYLWALCEGYKTCGDEDLADKIRNFDYDKLPENLDLGWANMSGYAVYAFLTTKEPVNKVPYDYNSELLCRADELVEISKSESYGCSIKDTYPWGSNMTVANNALIMLMANDISPKSEYEREAKKQLDYLCGANTNSYCFLTGYGTLTPLNPHHRPSQALSKCMPGMLVGGPDSNLEDPFAKKVLAGYPNAHRYFDSAQTYSCNEITIYWNSPFIYLMSNYMK